MMDARWRGFMAGWLIAVAARSLLLDAIGKEDYIEMIPNLWVEWYITVPLAVVFLLAAMVVMAPEDGTKKDGG